VEGFLHELAGVRPPNTVVSFVRDRRDMFMLAVRPAARDTTDPAAFKAHVTILEPLSVSRSKRVVAQATIQRRGGPKGAVYQVSIPVRPKDESGIVPSYVGLVLLDKVLSRVAVPARTAQDVDAAWAG
jgi:hypothetical protein